MKTAEEILEGKETCVSDITYHKDVVIQAMEEYANQFKIVDESINTENENNNDPTECTKCGYDKFVGGIDDLKCANCDWPISLEDDFSDLIVVSHGCNFRQYGEEERKCTKCGYVIGGGKFFDGDINKQLECMIKAGYPIPKCGINKREIITR